MSGPRTTAFRIAVALLIAAVPIAWLVRPQDGDRAAPAPVPSLSAVARRAMDPCLVGTWRAISMSVATTVNGTKANFRSNGGRVMRIRPDGRTVDSYAGLAPLTSTFRGDRYAQTIRGTVSYRIETWDGQMLVSERSGRLTYAITRDGKRIAGGDLLDQSDAIAYVCGDTRLSAYGDSDDTIQFFLRISRNPVT
jgi:hypothetical protein